ncbi:hypothetical protein OSTOST_04163 [Ostertagia ostertagi]
MSLCIVGSESLDVLESMLKALDFGAIENKDAERKEWLENPYGKEQLGEDTSEAVQGRTREPHCENESVFSKRQPVAGFGL